MVQPVALLLFQPSAALAIGLNERFEIIRFDQLQTAQAREWLGTHGERVQAIVTNGKTGCENWLIEALPHLKIIAIHGVGFDRLDVELAHRKRIAITHTPGVLTGDVADLAVGLIIALLRGIPSADHHVRDGLWAERELPLATRVSGKRFGILGLGRIGSAIADRLSGFGSVSYTCTKPKRVRWPFYADVVHLAAASDVLIVACAANEATQCLVGEDVFDALGPNGYLVNIARGSVIDEVALARALSAGALGGAALDVFQDEPNVRVGLVESQRTVLTPHIGSATAEARQEMADMVLASLDSFLAGEPLRNQLQYVDAKKP